LTRRRAHPDKTFLAASTTAYLPWYGTKPHGSLSMYTGRKLAGAGPMIGVVLASYGPKLWVFARRPRAAS
jgi:hypothetical protein